tara:strand:- start:3229 stop:5466 length:2238 start_codon:yes stop_codon:yes gene_type:complete
MSQATQDRFRRIIEAARKRDGGANTDTMIVNSHLSQMKLFMLRQGLEFYPAQDTFGFRKQFLAQLIEENEIDTRLEGIVDDFLIDGKGLFYFRPIRDTYRIMWFSKDNYRAYYDSVGQLEEIELIYSFSVRESMNAAPVNMAGQQGSMRYVKLRVRRDEIKETITNEKPSFDATAQNLAFAVNKTRTLTNSLGFIPAVESFNNMRSTGMDATGEFNWLAEQIVTHDDLVKNIRTNIHFFGNPTLVSSRPKHDLVESGDEGDGLRPTISSQAGFYAANRPSTRVSSPLGGGSGGGGMKVPRIIANVESTDRAVYLTPDAVSGDQNLYARQYREEIRTALGGVDELGITAGATAYEIKSLYGRAATTASRRCRGLLTYGLCKLFGLVIFNEEKIFRESFAGAIGLEKPQAPIREEYEDGEAFSAAAQEFDALMKQFEGALQDQIGQAVQSRQLPPGTVGLIPDGDRKVEWRWKGPVFEDGTEDILNSSIVVRNLQELGVNSIEALRYLFPDKTDEERSAMLSGYPFRMAQATQQSIGTFLTLVENMRQIPHPQAPDLPMLADPKMDLTPYIYRALDFLKRELTYAGQYSDDTGGGDPERLDSIERARADAGLPISSGPDRPTFVPDTFGAAAGGADAGQLPTGGASGESMAAGVRTTQRQLERDAELPTSGSLLNTDPSASGTPGAGMAGFGSSAVPGGSFSFGAADLNTPSNAGVLPGPDTGAQLQQRADRTRERRVSRRRQQRKS